MFKEFDQRIAATQTHFREDMQTIRTGRAHPSLIAKVMVDAYHSKMPLEQIASISAADAKMLVVEPYDRSLAKEIERAISTAPLGLMPTVDGTMLRVKLPDMTEETRRGMVKLIGQKTEDARVAIRQAREDSKRTVESQKKSNEITEDDRYRLIEELDKKTKHAIEQLETLAAAKEKEVMTV